MRPQGRLLGLALSLVACVSSPREATRPDTRHEEPGPGPSAEPGASLRRDATPAPPSLPENCEARDFLWSDPTAGVAWGPCGAWLVDFRRKISFKIFPHLRTITFGERAPTNDILWFVGPEGVGYIEHAWSEPWENGHAFRGGYAPLALNEAPVAVTASFDNKSIGLTIAVLGATRILVSSMGKPSVTLPSPLPGATSMQMLSRDQIILVRKDAFVVVDLRGNRLRSGTPHRQGATFLLWPWRELLEMAPCSAHAWDMRTLPFKQLEMASVPGDCEHQGALFFVNHGQYATSTGQTLWLYGNERERPPSPRKLPGFDLREASFARNGRLAVVRDRPKNAAFLADTIRGKILAQLEGEVRSSVRFSHDDQRLAEVAGGQAILRAARDGKVISRLPLSVE